MVRFKQGVEVRVFRAQLVNVLSVAVEWTWLQGVDVEVNSIDDAAVGRGPETLHGLSLAVDLDTAGDRAEGLLSLSKFLRRVLGPGYDVVLEADHVHVEFDPKR